ncbi:hypothetical protein KKC97_04770 [bacterium]|nr:hypothetical protein [bacterium]
MPADKSDSLSQLITSISAAFEVSAADPKHVAETCDRLHDNLPSPLSDSDFDLICQLARLLSKRTGEVAATLFRCLKPIAGGCKDPWPLLQCMLSARDDLLARSTLGVMQDLSLAGKLTVDRATLSYLSEQVEMDESRLRNKESLERIRYIMEQMRPVESHRKQDIVLSLYLSDEDLLIRCLAARILDLSESAVLSEHTRQVLGDEHAEFLDPYLTFTRATHLDLLYLLPQDGTGNSLLSDLRQAEAECGKVLLRELIAVLGWPGINLGLIARRHRRLEIDGSLPLLVSPTEALLFAGCTEVRPTPDVFLFIAQGASSLGLKSESESSNSVSMFRNLNLAHAEVLETILDVTPLTRERVLDILNNMEKIVSSFITLFADYAPECAILADVFYSIKDKIIAEVEGNEAAPEVSPNLTRLVLMFEDPTTLGDVSTLHGLKRYLHQRGLQLGFRLVETQREPQREVSMILARENEILHIVRGIQYSNFEPAAESDTVKGLPFALEMLVEGLSRQLLYGQRSFPAVSVFSYGAEAHYYITFRNHPIFLRVDYSPPLRGGMADLQYYGVSQYELSDHPDLSLGAIRHFLERLDFNVEIDQVRIHARCDKERVLDLGRLCERIGLLFHLIPHLMDIDWVIGSLDLDSEAKQKIAAAWARSFLDWGSLPIHRLLTKDRIGILSAIETQVGATQEISWNGEGNYADRYLEEPSPLLVRQLNSTLNGLGLDGLPIPRDGIRRPLGLYRLERRLFGPLRDAISRGEIEIIKGQLQRAPAEHFKRRHEVELFAELLQTGGEELAKAVAVGWLVMPLERTLEFTTSGSIEGHDIQRTRLRLRDQTITLYVMRDSKEAIQLGMFAHGTVLYNRKAEESPLSETNACFDFIELATILRGNNYLTTGCQISLADAAQAAQLLISDWEAHLSRLELIEGEQIIHGLKASRGRATGRAVLGIAGREPRDVTGGILVLPTINPKQNAFVHASAGVLSTGGSVLSHAGLMAAQFRKPSMIVDGRWIESDGGSPALLCPSTSYREMRTRIGGYDVVMRHEAQTLDYVLHDGDLAVVDANHGDVHILGQNPETLALYDALQQLAETRSEVSRISGNRDILAARGRRLHARHLVEKLLRRPIDPVVAKHIILESLLECSETQHESDHGDRVLLLTCLLQNPQVSKTARTIVGQAYSNLAHRFQTVCRTAAKQIPDALLLAEIICIRLEAQRIWRTLMAVIEVLKHCGVEHDEFKPTNLVLLDDLARDRLLKLREEQIRQLDSIDGNAANTRYTLRHLEWLDSLLGIEQRASILALHSSRLEQNDAQSREEKQGKYTLKSAECGYELAAVTGWKAANLAEIDRLTDRTLVPPWFVVTDTAFQEMLNTPLSAATPFGHYSIGGSQPLRQSIDAVLSRDDLNADQKSIHIQNLWEHVTIPPAIYDAITQAYSELCPLPPSQEDGDKDSLTDMVAVRSSGCEEDVETNVRAGEFETFLYIRGLDSLLTHIKKTWSSLWTPRAIHSRASMGETLTCVSAGVIVQRIVESRISGVLLTINTADYDMTQMVINVGLGLGEGVVSGKVATDQIIADKKRFAQRETASFRYTTGDKREQVVFDRQAGVGTRTVETLFHQRLRPAIEYSELQELVDTATFLERNFCYPLDIEFAFEETELRILQVRPVPSYLSDLQETIETYPLQSAIKKCSNKHKESIDDPS